MKIQITKPFIYLFFLLFGFSLMAQTGDIRGFIYDEKNGEAVLFASVYLEGTTVGATSDINGFYSISRVEPGNYTLVSTFVGYDTTKVQINVEANKIVNQKIFLNQASITMETVTISASKEEAKTEVKTSTIKLTPKTIKKIPAVGGEPDLAQYLQVLPGVVFTGDQGGQLYIRGGSPIQTKVLLDGMTVYNPFHSIGLFSVFDTDIIKNVDVLTGGFNASYGGRISAIVDVATKDGNKKKLQAKVSASPFLAKAVLEGPLIKLKDNGASASFIVSYKNSFLDKTSTKLYDYIDEGGLPYSFEDIYTKVSFNSDNGSKINLFGFNFNDRVNYTNATSFKWNNYGVGSNFVIVPGKARSIINGHFAYSNYDIVLSEPDQKDRKSSIGGFNFGVDFKYFLQNGSVNYGLEVMGFSTVFEFFNSVGLKINEDQNTTEIAGFLVYTNNFGKLVIEPSVRLSYYASLATGKLEPRLGMKYNVTDKFRVKFSTGYFTQNFISTKSDRDVVNLFTGFLSAPEGTLETVDGDEVNSNIQSAFHAIIGTETNITKHIELNVEAYYKRYGQLININRNKLFPSDPDYIVEQGNAYGLDFFAKYDYKRFFIWGVYSLGYVNREFGDVTYAPHFDRRHNANFLGSYTAGKNLDWEFSLRWNLGSGFPFTKTQGFFEQIDFGEGLDTDYLSQNGSLGIIFDEELNGGRLPYYHRLDASIKKKFILPLDMKMEIMGSVTNVYDRSNIFYFDRITYTRVNQLPILPSIGINISYE